MPLVNPGPVDLFIGSPAWRFINVATTAWPTANAARLTSFQVNRPVTVSTAYVRVGTQSGNMDLGIYNAGGSRLASTGSFLVPAPAITVSRALTASVSLWPGQVYWAAIAVDNATAALASFSAAAIPQLPGYLSNVHITSSFPLPDPIAIGTTEQSAANAVYVVAFV